MEEAAASPELSAQLGNQRPTLLFCGDLNSDLNDGIPGALELLAKGRLPAGFWDWQYGAGFRWGKGEDGEGDAAGEAAGAAGQQAQAAAAADAGGQDGTGEFGEVSKMQHSAVEHAAPASPSARAAGAAAAGEEAAFVTGVDLEIPFRLAAADALRTPFTNHVKGYQGLLDYIWCAARARRRTRPARLPCRGRLHSLSPRAPACAQV